LRIRQTDKALVVQGFEAKAFTSILDRFRGELTNQQGFSYKARADITQEETRSD
jgi:hypothetical protein